jgi:hypothetical protein
MPYLDLGVDKLTYGPYYLRYSFLSNMKLPYELWRPIFQSLGFKTTHGSNALKAERSRFAATPPGLTALNLLAAGETTAPCVMEESLSPETIIQMNKRREHDERRDQAPVKGQS